LSRSLLPLSSEAHGLKLVLRSGLFLLATVRARAPSKQEQTSQETNLTSATTDVGRYSWEVVLASAGARVYVYVYVHAYVYVRAHTYIRARTV